MAGQDRRDGPPGLLIRRLAAGDLAAADRINRLAFGTFFGLDDPMTFRGDAEAVRCRFALDPEGGFAAELDGRLVASAQVMDWGGVGILGPLTVDPEWWGSGIAHALMPHVVGLLDARGHAVTGLFTHPQSPSHIRLYEAFGYRMQRITGVMAKDVAEARMPDDVELFSALGEADRAPALDACRGVTETVFHGLDLRREIGAVADRGLGDTPLLLRGGRIVGFAVCHHGAESEGGSAQLMIKFAAVARGDEAGADFGRLVAACEALASARGSPRIVAGTNTARHEAYDHLRRVGYRTFMNGISMIRADGPGYNAPGFYVIDDWR